MKKYMYISWMIVVLSLLSTSVYAQGKVGDLKGINYQAVAIDEDGKPIVGTDIEGKPLHKKTIGVRFTITQELNGPIQWEETHTVQTDKYGLFSLVIGQGEQTGGSAYDSLLNIPWIDADQFLKVEIAKDNDGNYRVVSNQQFMTVPYSFYTDDIADDAITTYKILDSTVLNQDISTGAVDSRVILDYTIINEDIATSAVDSRTILDSTIINEDIATGAVDSRTILDYTIINEDIATSAVDSRTILDSTIINEDIATGAVDSRTILDGTIQNEDIADGTINLKTKVTDTLAVEHGGTGGAVLPEGHILVGQGANPVATLPVTDSAMLFTNIEGHTQLYRLKAGARTYLIIDSVNNTITISAMEQAAGPGTDSQTIDFGNIPTGDQSVRLFNYVGLKMGDIILPSVAVDLQGLTMTAYVVAPDQAHVVLFNGSNAMVGLGPIEVSIANFGQP